MLGMVSFDRSSPVRGKHQQHRNRDEPRDNAEMCLLLIDLTYDGHARECVAIVGRDVNISEHRGDEAKSTRDSPDPRPGHAGPRLGSSNFRSECTGQFRH